MALLIIIGLMFMLAAGRGEAGKFICQLCFPFCLLAFLLALCGYYESNLKFGLGGSVFVVGLLTFGFGFGAFQPARCK